MGALTVQEEPKRGKNTYEANPRTVKMNAVAAQRSEEAGTWGTMTRRTKVGRAKANMEKARRPIGLKF